MVRNGRIVFAIICVIIAIMLVCSLGEYLILYLAFGLEDNITKWQIDNPYVDSRYKGWKTVILDEENSIKIPTEWQITDTDGVYSIRNNRGELWGVGTSFGTDDDAYTNCFAFAAEYVSIEETNISIQPLEGFDAMNASGMYTITGRTAEYSEKYYCIELHKLEVDYFFVLFSDLSQSSEDYDFAEAIVYSFAY